MLNFRSHFWVEHGGTTRETQHERHIDVPFAAPKLVWNCLELQRTTWSLHLLVKEPINSKLFSWMPLPHLPHPSLPQSPRFAKIGIRRFEKIAHQDFLICPQDTQNQDVFSLLVNEISVAIYIDVSCRSMRWIF